LVRLLGQRVGLRLDVSFLPISLQRCLGGRPYLHDGDRDRTLAGSTYVDHASSDAVERDGFDHGCMAAIESYGRERGYAVCTFLFGEERSTIY
jgi:hypothetical protein